jgi:hypothetical protein
MKLHWADLSLSGCADRGSVCTRESSAAHRSAQSLTVSCFGDLLIPVDGATCGLGRSESG